MSVNLKSFYLFVNKPEGITSQKCLTLLKKKFGFKKIGHHGTLDPFATGLLLVGIGEATKYFSYLDDSKKTYEATLCLGKETNTLDLTGEVVDSCVVPDLELNFIEQKAQAMSGSMWQEPPMYSAVKVNGKKLYELARQNINIERKKREITVYEFVVLSWNKPFIKFKTTVSRGTYVRVLADLFAKKLGCVGCLSQLNRTMLCGFDKERYFDLDKDSYYQKKVVGIDELLTHYYKIELTQEEAVFLMSGKWFNNRFCSSGETKICTAFLDDLFLGLIKVETDNVKPLRLMNLHEEIVKTDNYKNSDKTHTDFSQR